MSKFSVNDKVLISNKVSYRYATLGLDSITEGTVLEVPKRGAYLTVAFGSQKHFIRKCDLRASVKFEVGDRVLVAQNSTGQVGVVDEVPTVYIPFYRVRYYNTVVPYASYELIKAPEPVKPPAPQPILIKDLKIGDKVLPISPDLLNHYFKGVASGEVLSIDTVAGKCRIQTPKGVATFYEGELVLVLAAQPEAVPATVDELTKVLDTAVVAKAAYTEAVAKIRNLLEGPGFKINVDALVDTWGK